MNKARQKSGDENYLSLESSSSDSEVEQLEEESDSSEHGSTLEAEERYTPKGDDPSGPNNHQG